MVTRLYVGTYGVQFPKVQSGPGSYSMGSEISVLVEKAAEA